MNPNSIQLEDPELIMLSNNKKSGFNYRERRQDDWTENYTLYRDKVTTNRLTQRQSVNLPLMKQTIRTLLTNVDDMPVITFESLDNDESAEVFQNEYWKWTVEQNRMELKDVVDKRQVFFFGRTFDQWQIIDGRVVMSICDPEDILVSRYTDPTNLHSSRFLIHTHIFVPLSTLDQNPDYDKKAVNALVTFYGTQEGLIKAAENAESYQKKTEKMADLGLSDVDSPVLGETYVELTLHFVFREGEKDAEKQPLESQIFMYVEADDQQILMKKPLEEVIGETKDHFWRTHYPYNTWADDIDMQDFWTDGIADIMRTPNKIANAWFSQMVENRTLRNLNMQVYDSTKEGFTPSTFTPIAWGWYGVPGKPSEVYQQMQVADLSDSLDELNFLITMSEKATGAVANLQGEPAQKQVTLGEVKIAYTEAKERVKGMSKFYTQAWKDRGEMFLKLIEAGHDKLDAVTIYKKGRNSEDIYTREIAPKDWMTKLGYTTRVWSQDEKNAQDSSSLEKLAGVRNLMVDNPVLTEIVQRKALEFADLSPDEITQVMDFENQKRQALMNPMLGQPGAIPPPGAVPGTPVPAPAMASPAAVPPPIPAPPSKGANNKAAVDKLKGLRDQIAVT